MKTSMFVCTYLLSFFSAVSACLLHSHKPPEIAKEPLCLCFVCRRDLHCLSDLVPEGSLSLSVTLGSGYV